MGKCLPTEHYHTPQTVAAKERTDKWPIRRGKKKSKLQSGMEEDDGKDRGRGKARTMEREPQRSNKEQEHTQKAHHIVDLTCLIGVGQINLNRIDLHFHTAAKINILPMKPL